MRYSAIVNPYLWLFVSGAFAGVSIRYFVVIGRLSGNVGRDVKLRATLAPLFAAGAIILAVAGLLLQRWLPGGLDVLDLRSELSARYLGLGYCFVAAAAVSFVTSRFIKSIGIPFLFLVSLFILFAFIGLSSWTAFHGEIRGAEIRILSEERNGGTSHYAVEMIHPEGISEFITLSSDELLFPGRILTTEDYFFLGPRTLYRIDHPGDTARAEIRDLDGWLSSMIVSLPWYREEIFLEQLDEPLSPAAYALLIGDDGKTRLVPTYLLYNSTRNS